MSVDLAGPIRDALVASNEITALLATYAGEPAVFTRQPVPGNAVYPFILVTPDNEVLDEDGLTDDRPIIFRNVIVYSSNQNQTSARLANQIAFLIYGLLHRQWRALVVPDWKVVDIIANGPIILVGEDQTVGREIPLTIKLAKPRIPVEIVVPPPFSPLDIPFLLAWIDFSDISTLFQTADTSTPVTTDGQPIGRASDKSGNGNHFFTTFGGLTRPTYSTTLGPNALSVAFFNTSGGADPDALDTAPVAVGGTVLSVFIVVKLGTSLGPNVRVITSTHVGGSSDDFNTPNAAIFMYAPSGTIGSGFRNSSPLSNGTVGNNIFRQIGSIFDGANHTFYINNVAQAPVANADTFGANLQFHLGSRPVLVEGLDGFVCEVIIAKAAVDLATRDKIFSYLQSKWGVG